jgi:DNA-binding NtrC family response regulator
VQPDPWLPVVGASLAPIVALLGVFARQEETLLLTGPTGTGKSRIARWCHQQSPRRTGPFETVDLLSVPEDMQMGELFGWRRGAFTGAAEDHRGFVARAEGGTLFVDEIDKLSPRAQSGLLYLLEEKRYRVLGDSRQRECDVRFVVGTNADLWREVEQGRFREDLYYRINVLGVRLPPLDERRDEIAPWARFMLERRHAEQGEAGSVRLDPAASALLEQAPWPGNLRQLDNVVRRAYVLALAERTGAADLTVGEAQVRAALLAEGTPGSGIRLDPLRAAAAQFVAEAERRGGGLDLDLLDGLRGLALAEAIRRTGSKEAAFRLLGRESLVKARNHHKALQRELARAADLYRALGLPAEPEEGEEP